jgi:hypothetical protein
VNFLDLLDHVVFESTADAAIADLHDVLLLLYAQVAILHHVHIDIEFADIVQNHSHFLTLGVG